MTYQTPSGERVTDTDPRLLVREDGRVEWLCKHSVGHPVGHLRQWQDWMNIHGCDGCCQSRGMDAKEAEQ
ncbi:MAG TPA: hypothetical protein VFH61_13710 [Thermoleophilia bacterium]|nr:hypothetical protein [Thermoleophilia bacterium]